MLRTICLHGPACSGKSAMAPRLASHFDSICIADFGQIYRERFGGVLAMADLIQIAHGQDARARAALHRGDFPVILDTDPLMSALLAEMTFGRRDRWFDAWNNTADLYLLFDMDLPVVGAQAAAGDRERFLDLSRREFDRRGLSWAMVSGEGSKRYLSALSAIRHFAGAPLQSAG